MRNFFNQSELNIENQPKLNTIAPLTNGIVNIFIILNFVLALAIYSQAPNKSLIIIGSYAMSYVWVGVFVAIGLALLHGKVTNNWQIMKLGMMAGLFVKAIFTYSLIVLGLNVGFKGIIGVTGLWLAVTGVQFHTVRSFKIPGGRHGQ